MNYSCWVRTVAVVVVLFAIAALAEASAFRITGPNQISAQRGNASFTFVVGPSKRVADLDPNVKVRIAGSGGTARVARERELPRGRRYRVRIRGIVRNFTAVIVVKAPRSGRRATTDRVRVQAE